MFACLLIVIAAFVPSVINSSIQKGVYDSVRLDPDTMGDTQLAKFLNGSIGESFYLFTITNLADVLANGAKINFKEVGPINTRRHGLRYNVSWDTANSRVTHQWLTTFEVLPDSQALLDTPIVTINPFYLAAAANVQQQVIAAGAGQNLSDPKSFRPTSQIDYLDDSTFQAGFISSKLLARVLPLFTVPIGPFLTSIRSSSVSAYAQFVPAFCTQTGASYTQAKLGWAQASPYLSLVASSYFTGFELATPLASADQSGIADRCFDSTNESGFASSVGLAKWICTISTSLCSLKAPLPTLADIGTSLGLDAATADATTIQTWLKSLMTAIPMAPGDVGSAYQKTVTAAIAGQIQGLRAYGGVYSGLVANASNWAPATWADVGALQFGSGFLVGATANRTLVAPNGIGVSIADLPSAQASDPLNFGDGNPLKEPIEFFGGLRYYIQTNSGPVNPKWPQNAQLAQLWQMNRALLFANDTTTGRTSETAQIALNIREASALIQLLTADTRYYGGLLAQLAPLVGKYAASFIGCISPPNNGLLATCINGATQAAGTAYDNVSGGLDGTFFRFPPGSPTGQVIVTKTNWFAIYAYLHLYLGHTFTGTLAEMDPQTGVAPQNSGLFVQHTVRELLFGYTNRYGQEMPAIAGPILSPDTIQSVIDADYLAHQGREWIQDTGHADINTVGQWIQWEGTEQYQTACDVDDPQRTGECLGRGSLTEAEHNWQVWGEPAILKGSGSSLQIQPFMEDSLDEVRQSAFYVGEIRRPVVVEYQRDVTVKGIDMRRYGLWLALANATYTYPLNNTEKNQERWYQGGVPDGFYSMKSYQGGYSAMVSIAHFGHADPQVWQGCTCDSGDCANWYREEDHATFIDIHPLTGLTMQGHKRLQANFKLDAREFFTYVTAAARDRSGKGELVSVAVVFARRTAHLSFPFTCAFSLSLSGAKSVGPTTPVGFTGAGFNSYYNNLFAFSDALYVPYYWADINDLITDEDAQKVRDSEKSIRFARNVRKFVPIVFVIFGPIFLLASIGALVYFCRATPKDAPK